MMGGCGQSGWSDSQPETGWWTSGVEPVSNGQCPATHAGSRSAAVHPCALPRYVAKASHPAPSAFPLRARRRNVYCSI